MTGTLTSADFAPYLDESFHVSSAPDAALEMRLVEVSDMTAYRPAVPDGSAHAPFALVLRGPLTPILPQRIYRVTHSRMGVLEIFLVPIGPDQEGMRYEAVFN